MQCRIFKPPESTVEQAHQLELEQKTPQRVVLPSALQQETDYKAAYLAAQKQKTIPPTPPVFSASGANMPLNPPASKYIEQKVSAMPPVPVQIAIADEWEFTVLKFGTEVSLRGRLGKYLTAVPVAQQNAAAQFHLDATKAPAPAQALIAATASNPQQLNQSQSQPQPIQSFLLGAEGQGIGEALDCFVFVNAENREDVSPIKYGMTVAIKAPAAKER
jgi:hypothetical protein